MAARPARRCLIKKRRMRTFFTGLICLLLAQAIHAQAPSSQFRLNAYAGYVFDDGIDSYYNAFSYYDGTIRGGFHWGIGAEYLVQTYYGIELSYYRQDTEAPMNYYDNGVKSATFDLGGSWILLGGNRYFKLDATPVVQPYAGAMLGIALVDVENPRTNYSDNATKFAWGIKGGSNFQVSPRIALKVQAILLSAAQAAGGALFFGTGGAGAGVATYSSVLQFGFHGGLAVTF